jgi:hypothetical protein
MMPAYFQYFSACVEVLGGQARSGLGSCGDRRRGRRRLAPPARAMAGIIGHGRVREEESFCEIFEHRVIPVELPLQRAMRHASTALAHGQGRAV